MRRRDLLAAIGAASLAPGLTWADARDPAYVSAARHPDGSYRLCGLDRGGAVLFDLPLPDRGHAAAAHPTRPEAVAFARRPGRFAIVLDCARGVEAARLTPPANRHFYGHGTFSSDGGILFTTENDLDTLDGRIGLWDAANRYARIGDIPSGGIGPHEMVRLPGSETLVVANGGIATHPDSGRTALNLATMRPNLAFLTPDGQVRDLAELDPALRQNSIRHLAVRRDGLVAAGMQWNGPKGEDPPLVLLCREGGDRDLLEADPAAHRSLQGYVGSVSFTRSGSRVAVTSPRGGVLQVFDVARRALSAVLREEDVCGLSPAGADGILVTTGRGISGVFAGDTLAAPVTSVWSWDNHVIAVG